MGASRDEIDAWVGRIEAGATPDAAAEGLDVTLDAYGVHPAMHLLALPIANHHAPAALSAAAEWMLERGADPGALLVRAIDRLGFSMPWMVDVVLAREPRVPLDDALRRAHQVRDLTMMRRLVALGADPSVLAGSVRSDLVTPRQVSVSYRASAEPQKLHIEVVHRPQQLSHDAHILEKYAIERIARLGALGALGSDLFAPSGSRVTTIETASADTDAGRALSGLFEVRGVAPAALALLARLFLCHCPVSLTIQGELALDDGPLSVDDARALRWFSDFSTDPYRTWSPLPFPVTAKPKKGFAVIEHDDAVARAVSAAVLEIESAAFQTLPRVPVDTSIADMSHHFDAKKGAGKTELVIKRFGKAPLPDRTTLRAMLVHALANLEGVKSLRWCDDADAKGMADADAPHKAKLAAMNSKNGEQPAPGASRTFGAMLDELAPDLAGVFGVLEKSLLPGACIPVETPSSCADGTVLFRYLPLAGASGEAPVLGLDPTDDGILGVFAPTLDGYRARLDSNVSATVFAPSAEGDAILGKLVAKLPVRRRKSAPIASGVISLGQLVFEA